MKLRITSPDEITWEYTLHPSAADLIAKFGAGELDRISFTEQSPEISRDYPMRFELDRGRDA